MYLNLIIKFREDYSKNNEQLVLRNFAFIAGNKTLFILM